ncbi:BREX-1 system adenine-specific DNA-methyltransferase PglX [Candidatus Gracilibacteria bacterium]|nr:BREX-1 system adenine-specific DNA-methyltransferase PglX [Candidatus Gracilibacteria bacterium]
MVKLFKDNIIREKLSNFEIPDFDAKINIIQNWFKLHKDGTLKNKKEEELEGPFGDDFFGKILGYESLTENETYSRKFQPKVPEGGQKADIGLGIFGEEINLMKVIVELKDAKTSLDKPQQRAGNLTPVQQAFKYKPYFRECDFIIVSNFIETRIYIDSYYDYESFTLESLANPNNDYFEFKKFYYLLCKSNLITKSGDSNTKSLLSVIRTQEKEITKKFYKDYSLLRLELLRDLRDNNSLNGKISKEKLNLIFEKAQKIIDRIVFIHFCEDINDLLPNGKLKENLLRAEEIGFTPWDVLKIFFRGVDKGSEKLGIKDGYNGGLFAEDKELDNLKVGDEICKKFVDLGDYDFANDLSVNILGHIFEQSISDIEEIKNKIQTDENEKTISKRKKDGIFYTPEYIIDYIVKNSLGKYLEEKENEILEEIGLRSSRSDTEYRNKYKAGYLKYQEILQNIKVLDPACGSGAFLVKVFDFLLSENKRINRILEENGQSSLMGTNDYIKNILQNNIYGVDLNEESVEITKLSLWLKTAQKGKKLANLDSNIKCGNSLIDDEVIAGNKAFKWETEFKEIMANGGFDVIVGNPPYIKEFVNKNVFNGLKNSPYYQGKMDLWQFFACKGLDLLKDNGFISYIAPNNWITNAGASIMRNKILEDGKIIDFIDFGDFKVFEDAGIQTMIFIIKKTKNNEKYQVQYMKILDSKLSSFEVDNRIKLLGDIEGFDYFYSDINKKNFKNKNINFNNPYKNEVLEKIKNEGNFILEDKEVAQGIVGAPDEAYLLDNINNFTDEEKNFIKKFHTNSGKYFSGNQDKYIIYLTNINFNGKSIENYINIFNHFEPKKQQLIEARIKLQTPNKPYYFLHRERDERFFQKGAKIIAGTRVLKPAFYYTEDEYYCSRALNIIKTDRINLKYLSTILNSSISNFWLRRNGKMTGDLLQVDKGPLLSVPIKNISFSEQKPFVEKADFMLDKNKELQEKLNSSLEFLKQKFGLEKLNTKLEKFYLFDFLEFKKALNIKKISMNDEEDLMNWFNSKKSDLMNLKTEIDICDKKIDEMVFDLYGLDEEERKVVLGNNG